MERVKVLFIIFYIRTLDTKQMLTRVAKLFIDVVEKHHCRPIPLYSVALNTNKLFAHLWVAGFDLIVSCLNLMGF